MAEPTTSSPSVEHNSFHQAFEQHGVFAASETPAIVDPVGSEGGQVDHRVVTYGQLLEGVNRVAAGLASLGVVPGDRVLLMVPMSTELYQAILAVLKMGAVCLFVDPADGVRHLDRAAASLAPKAFLAVPRAHVLRLLSRAVRRIPIQVSTWPTVLAWTTPWTELLAKGEAGAASFPTAPVRAGDPAMISFTSGSSGVPKGVVRSHSDLRTIFAMLCRHEAKQSKGINLCAFPVLPIDDLSWGRTSLLPCAEPGRLGLARPGDLASQMRQFPPSLVSAPPSLLRALADHCRATGERFPSVEHIFSGGGVLPIPLARELSELLPQATLHLLYGSTEAEPVSLIEGDELLRDTAEQTEKGAGYCAGRTAPETRLAIVEPVEGPLQSITPIAGIGEVVVSGPHVNRAYWRDEAMTRRHKFHDAATGLTWHRMGDAGYLDETGRLWLVGRISERVETSRKVLYPGQVEPLFDGLTGVRKTALIGVTVVRDGQPRTVASLLVELSPGTIERELLIQTIRERVRLQGLPIEDVRECEAILYDRRIGAKIQYSALAELHGPEIRERLGDSLDLRMAQYREERFSIFGNGLLALLLVAAIADLAGGMDRWLAIAVTALITLGQLWCLRIAGDRRKPSPGMPKTGGPVGRGIVTPAELTQSAMVILAGQAAGALCLGLAPLGWWLAGILWGLAVSSESLAPASPMGSVPHRLLTAGSVFFLAQFAAASTGPTAATLPKLSLSLVVLVWLAMEVQARVASSGTDA